MKPGVEFTAQRARWFDLPPQGESESDIEFRERVAGALRDRGKIIEAHEAYHNCLYDDPSGAPMTGILGAVAQVMQGQNYGSKGNRQVGDDIAAGVCAQSTHDEDPLGMLLAAFLTRVPNR